MPTISAKITPKTTTLVAVKIETALENTLEKL